MVRENRYGPIRLLSFKKMILLSTGQVVCNVLLLLGGEQNFFKIVVAGREQGGKQCVFIFQLYRLTSKL